MGGKEDDGDHVDWEEGYSNDEGIRREGYEDVGEWKEIEEYE